MKKIIKTMFIILFYVFMFWGLINSVKTILYKINKCNCNCDQPVKIVREIKEVIVEKTTEEEENVVTNTNLNATVAAPPITGTKADYQAYAHNLVINTYLWSEDDYQALIQLWEKESGWNANAHNNSGAHGIPQSLPASKMQTEGDDYYTNGYTQIRWGLKYINNRYGSPLNAWKHFQNKNWY